MAGLSSHSLSEMLEIWGVRLFCGCRAERSDTEPIVETRPCRTRHPGPSPSSLGRPLPWSCGNVPWTTSPIVPDGCAAELSAEALGRLRASALHLPRCPRHTTCSSLQTPQGGLSYKEIIRSGSLGRDCQPKEQFMRSSQPGRGVNSMHDNSPQTTSFNFSFS